MNPRLFIRAMVFCALSGFSAIQNSYAAVQVYIGYVDDEANGVVTSFLNPNQKDKVLVLAGHLDSVNVLGRNYLNRPTITAVTPPKIEKHEKIDDVGDYFKNEDLNKGKDKDSDKPALASAPPAHPSPTPTPTPTAPNSDAEVLAKSLLQKVTGQEYLTRLDNSSLHGSSVTSNFSIAQFPAKAGEKVPPPKDDDNLIIVIRPPVNGREPAMMKEYLKTMLSAISQLPQASAAKGGIQVSSFGTAGGIDDKYAPNDIVKTKSSLFVGAIPVIDKKGHKKYAATIEFATVGDKDAPVQLYYQEFSYADEAEAAAKAAFNRWVAKDEGDRGIKDKCIPKDDGVSVNTKWMSSAATQAVKQAILADPGTSLTTSFFADPTTKRTAQKMGLSDVNMEDFHIIDLMNTTPTASVSIQRVISDPAFLPPEATSAVRNWMTNATYSKDKYVDALLWGLKGRSLWAPPSSGKWTVFAGLPQDQSKKWIAQIPFADGAAPIDPYFYDIAGNLLRKMASQSFDASEFISPSIKDKLSGQAYDQLKAHLEKTSNDLRQTARDLLNSSIRSSDDEKKARNKLSALLDKVVDFQVTENPLRNEIADIYSGKTKKRPESHSDFANFFRDFDDSPWETSSNKKDQSHSFQEPSKDQGKDHDNEIKEFKDYNDNYEPPKAPPPQPPGPPLTVSLLGAKADGQMKIWAQKGGGGFNDWGFSNGSSIDVSQFGSIPDDSIYRMFYKMSLLGLEESNTHAHALEEHDRMQGVSDKVRSQDTVGAH